MNYSSYKKLEKIPRHAFMGIVALSTVLLIVKFIPSTVRVHPRIPDSYADHKERFGGESDYSRNIEGMSSSLTTILKATAKLSAELVDEVNRSNVSVYTNYERVMFDGDSNSLKGITCKSTSYSPLTKLNRSNVSVSLTKAYLLFEEIDEQLSSNTLKFIQLSYFSAVWNLSMVEPWINTDTTYLSSLPAVNQEQALLFFDLYTKKEVEERLTDCFHSNLPPQNQNSFHFHNLNEAIIFSPRDVLIVRYMMTRWSQTKEMGECSTVSGKEIESTERRLNFFVQKVEEKAQEIHGPCFRFRIWRTICITAIPGIPFSSKNATVFIKGQLSLKREETGVGATVVIPYWRKIFSRTEKNFKYYYDPNFKFDGRNCKERCLPHSSTVLTAADRMLESLQLTEKFIGVYVRTERLSRTDQHQPGFINECLTEFYNVLESLEKEFQIPRSRVMLVHDAGKYGSNSFYYTNVQEMSKMILSKFQSLNIQTAYYEPNQFRDLPQHRAFVAAVEQEFLSRSYVLVTIGSGGFQINVVGRFKVRQSVDRAHELCNQ